MFFTATRTSIRQKTFGHIVFQTDATWMKPIFTRFTLHPKPTRVLLHLAMAPRVDLLRTKKTKKRRTQKPNQNNKHDNMRSKHSTPPPPPPPPPQLTTTTLSYRVVQTMGGANKRGIPRREPPPTVKRAAQMKTLLALADHATNGGPRTATTTTALTPPTPRTPRAPATAAAGRAPSSFDRGKDIAVPFLFVDKDFRGKVRALFVDVHRPARGASPTRGGRGGRSGLVGGVERGCSRPGTNKQQTTNNNKATTRQRQGNNKATTTTRQQQQQGKGKRTRRHNASRDD